MIELYDILTLEDDKDYAVASQLFLNGNMYYLLVEVDKDENPLNNSVIVKKGEIDNELAVINVDDEEELKEVAKHFEELIKNSAE